MTATAAPVPAVATTPTVGRAIRRWRFWAVVLLVLALLAVVTGLLTASPDGSVLGVDNAGESGGRALVSVLREQGVQVDVVTRRAQADAATGPLVVLDTAGLLGARDWRRLVDGRGRVVVIEPGFTALEALAPQVLSAGTPASRSVRPGCSLALARRAGTMSLSGADASLRSATATVCFGGELATVRSADTRVVLLADAAPFTNRYVTDAGNAAVALGALGTAPTLTWYVPDPLDFPTGGRTLQALTPAWVTPVVVLLLLSGLAVALQRGRRLGPVVIERMPVVVRSRETVEGRARLYARTRARLRAADALRIGAIGRMVPLLGLGSSATVPEVVVAVAAATGARRDAVAAVLHDADPGDDAALVRLSDDLARLEAAVRAAVRPGASRPRADGDQP